MHSNKPKFELACKTIGLILVISGIYMGLQTVLILVEPPKAAPPHQIEQRPVEIQRNFHETDLLQEGDVTDIWKKVLVVLTFESMLPLLLGLYLMKPDNLFSQYAYPADQRHAGRPPRGADIISILAMQQNLEAVDEAKGCTLRNGPHQPAEAAPNSGPAGDQRHDLNTTRDGFRL